MLECLLMTRIQVKRPLHPGECQATLPSSEKVEPEKECSLGNSLSLKLLKMRKRLSFLSGLKESAREQ